jgi:hypothetical protein
MLMAPPPTSYGVNPINRQATQLLGAPGAQMQGGFGSNPVGGRPGFGVPQTLNSMNMQQNPYQNPRPGFSMPQAANSMNMQNPYQNPQNVMAAALAHRQGIAPHLANGPAPMAGATPPLNYRPM